MVTVKKTKRLVHGVGIPPLTIDQAQLLLCALVDPEWPLQTRSRRKLAVLVSDLAKDRHALLLVLSEAGEQCAAHAELMRQTEAEAVALELIASGLRGRL